MARLVSWRWSSVNNDAVLVFTARGNGAEIAEGQRWRSMDPRSPREVEVVKICPGMQKVKVRNVASGRASQMNMNRFVMEGRHGFELIEGGA